MERLRATIAATLDRFLVSHDAQPIPTVAGTIFPAPRRIEMDIAERGPEGKKYVRLRCNELNIGDRLTDNKAEEDDYRFHDVFHLAYAAIPRLVPGHKGAIQGKTQEQA